MIVKKRKNNLHPKKRNLLLQIDKQPQVTSNFLHEFGILALSGTFSNLSSFTSLPSRGTSDGYSGIPSTEGDLLKQTDGKVGEMLVQWE